MSNRYDVISITMDTETKRRIDVLAAQDDRTRSNMLAWLVNQEFARRTELARTGANNDETQIVQSTGRAEGESAPQTADSL